MGGCNNKALIGLLIIVLASMTTLSQNPPQEQKVTKITVEHADSSLVPKEYDFKLQILMNNVVFRHDSAWMFCDSARLNSIENTLDAFGHVVMKQGDTLTIKSDFMRYEAENKMAYLRRNVVMENGEVTLFTDSFNYDREINLGFYFTGGTLLDSINELTSIYGEYSPETKMATFRQNVVLTNNNMVLTTDSLEYNTDSKLAFIVSPTEINSDSGYIYSERGIYNTETEYSQLYDRSLVFSNDRSKSITADSLHYDKLSGLTQAYGNMFLQDTVRKSIITGEFGYYDDLTELAFATDSAQLIDYSQGDSLYLHGDTLLVKAIEVEQRTLLRRDSATIAADSTGRQYDTLYTYHPAKEVIAYRGVRFYRTDFQGVCDSMYYSTYDSTLSMYRNPVLWNTGYQIYGDTIHTYLNDSTIDRMRVKDFAFAVQEVDSAHHNQLKGRIMTALFNGGEIYLLDVEGNAEALYYTTDDADSTYIGLVHTTGSYITFYINNRKPVKIKWTDATDMKMLPIPNLTAKDKFLQGYVDFNYLRPTDKHDIFRRKEMKAEDKHEPEKPRTSRRAAKEKQSIKNISQTENESSE